MEEVLGPGGQLHSFEAVFSPSAPPSADGSSKKDGLRRPRLLWDRATGAIDPAVATAWESYDIRLVLERNWKRLAPQLAGKLHVYTGSEDTFYLEGATRLLQQSLARLGSDAVVEIHPGKNHSTLLDRALLERIQQEMATSFLRSFPDGNHATRRPSRLAR